MLETVLLNFNFEPSLLEFVGLDPRTSEGKAKIVEVILSALEHRQRERELPAEEAAVCQALLFENDEVAYKLIAVPVNDSGGGYHIAHAFPSGLVSFQRIDQVGGRRTRHQAEELGAQILGEEARWPRAAVVPDYFVKSRGTGIWQLNDEGMRHIWGSS